MNTQLNQLIPKKTIILGFEKHYLKNKCYNIPIIQSFICNDFQVCFYCNFCLRFHYHGRSYNGIGDGHRSCHCALQESPFYQTGYILKLNQEQTQ